MSRRCLDEWFNRNRCCPAHPDQIPQEYTDSSVPSTSSGTTTTTTGDSASESDAENSEIAENSPSHQDYAPDDATTNELSGEPNNELTDGTSRLRISLQLDFQAENSTLSEDTNNTSDNSIHDVPGATSPGQYQPPDAITEADDSSPSSNSRSRQRPIGKTVVHVDDGSIHGSPGLFDEDEIAQLASKIKTILVQESPRSREYEGT